MRILIADDSAIYRRLLADVLATLPAIEMIGTAANGKIALQKVRELRPDVLTLDIEMPEMDGIGVLDALSRVHDRPDVLVLTAQSHRGRDLTIQALARGAFDFIAKPEASSPEQARQILTMELASRIHAIAHRRDVRAILSTRFDRNPQQRVERRSLAGSAPAQPHLDQIVRRMERISNVAKPELVLVGVSTGGPAALSQILPAIPRDIGVPIVVVQHMPPVFTKSLAESLAAGCAIRVQEAEQGEILEPGTAYIAPGGRQMRLDSGAQGEMRIDLTDDPPENNCRPAVDYLFRSVANHLPGRAMAVILTGMGSDGTLGLRLLKRHHCFVIAQDEATSIVYGMPKAAVDANVVDVVLPLHEIASRIVATVRGGMG